MLQFKTWLSEDFQGTHHTGAIGSPNGIDDGSVNIFDISDPKILDLLDTYVGTIGERTYVNPYTPIRALQTKLSTIGLFFSDRVNVKEGSELELPLMQFGGRYGRLSDESAEITSDDGITNKLGHGLALQLSFFKEENGRWGIRAAIVPVGDNVEVDEARKVADSPLDDKRIATAKQTMIGKDTGMSMAQAKSILKLDKTKKEDLDEASELGALQFIDAMASKGVDAKKAIAAWNKAASQVGDDEGKIKTAATKILGK